MFCLNDTMRYYLCPSKTDMRKGINSLIGAVHQQMGCDVKNGDVFIFIGNSKKLMKLLHPKSVIRIFLCHTAARNPSLYSIFPRMNLESFVTLPNVEYAYPLSLPNMQTLI